MTNDADLTLVAWPDAPGGPPTAEDIPVLLRQLEYLRYVPVRVLCRNAAGEPQVVLSFFSPKRAEETSTNIFWVTSERLRLLVDRLEARGLGRELKEWVNAEPARAARFHEDQLHYHALTERLFQAWLGRPPPRPGPFGIGGVRALDQVKCLHAQLAAHLATGRSVVGARVCEILAAEVSPRFLTEEDPLPSNKSAVRAVTVRRMRWDDPGDRARATALRTTIFVHEQQVPAELEMDEHDATACHVLALQQDEQGERAIGTGRMVVDGKRGRIGRMAVSAEARGRGVGGLLLHELLAWARDLNLDGTYLHAQCHALEFYLRHGYRPVGPVFQEAGIDHQEMERQP